MGVYLNPGNERFLESVSSMCLQCALGNLDRQDDQLYYKRRCLQRLLSFCPVIFYIIKNFSCQSVSKKFRQKLL